MAQGVQLPDGSAVAVRPGETPQDAYNRAKQMYPESFASKTPEEGPKSGFMPSLRGAVSDIKGAGAALAGRTGLMGLPEAEQYIAEQEAYKKKTVVPTQAGWTEDPLAKISELAGGSLPYIAAPLVAGAALGSAPVAGALGLGAMGSAALGLGAAGAASAGQFAGSNLIRQTEEGKKLGETDLTNAVLAAIPMAALDTVSLRMIPGMGKLFEGAGLSISKEAAQDLAKEGLKKTAADYALTTGRTMGVEGLTEASQQVFERMQAGLSLTDPSARAEYFDNFIGGAVLGGILAPVGRRVERGAEQTRFDTQQREEQKTQAIAAKAEQDRLDATTLATKQTPEYAQQAEQAYRDAEAYKVSLQEKMHKAPKGQKLTEDQKQDNRETQQALNEHATVLKDANKEYRQFRQFLPKEPAPPLGEDTTQLQQRDMFGNLPVPKAPELNLEGKPLERAAPEAAPQEQTDPRQQVRMLEQMVAQYQNQLQDASPQEIIALAPQYDQANAALVEARKAVEAMPKPVEAQLAKLHQKLGVAKEKGDVPAAAKLSQSILELEQQAVPVTQQQMEMQPFKSTVTEGVPGVSARMRLQGVAPQVNLGVEEQEADLAALQAQAEAQYLTQGEVTTTTPKARKPEAPQPLKPYTGIAEQSLLFPETGVAESTINVGQGKNPEKSRQDLIAEFEAAKQVRDRLGMQNAIEQMRTLAERSKARSSEARGKGVPQGELSGMLPEMMGQKLTATGSQPASSELTNAAKLEVTPQTLRRQVESLPEKLSPESEQLVGRMLGNFDEFTADPERAQLAAGFLQDVRTGVDTERSRDVVAELDKIEAAKQPEQASVFDEDLPVIEGPRQPLPTDLYAEKAGPPKPALKPATAPISTLSMRENADAAKRKAENERAARLATIPGESISFEAHRRALETLDDVGPRLDELAVKAADEALPKTTRDKANREIKKLSLARKFLESSGEGNGELRLKVEEELAKVQAKIKIQETAVAENATKSRKQELAKSKRRKKELTTQVKSFTSRAERTPIVTPTEKTRQAAENRATRFMQLHEALAIEGTTGALPAREIGPVVRKAQAAGNIRSGNIETTEERIINPGIKPEQGGTVKQPTPAQMRQIIKEASELAIERVKARAPLTAKQIRDLDVANQGSLLEAAFNMRTGLERNKRELQEKMDFSAKSPNLSEKNVELRAERELEMQGINRDLSVAKENESKLSKLFNDEAPAEEKQKTVKKAKKTRAQKAVENLDEEGMQRGTSGPNDTPLSEQNISRLRNGNVSGVLTDIANTSKNQVARRVAGKIQTILNENGVSSRLVDKTTLDSPNAPGMISKNGKLISLNERTGLSEESLIHEGVHAATMFELDKPDEKLTSDQRAAKQGLTKMMDQVKAAKDFDNNVIKDGDIHEFVAEGNASKVVQEYMRSQTFDGRSMLQKFKEFLLRLVGVRVPSSQNMLDKFLDMSEQFMRAKEENAPDMPAPKMRKADYKSDDALTKLAKKAVAQDKTFKERAGSHIGLKLEMDAVDMRAGVIKALNNAVEDPKTMGSTKLFRQAIFSITAADQSMAVTQMSLSVGPPKMVKDAKGYYSVNSSMENDAGQVFDAVQDIPDSYGNAEAKMALASVYMIAQRALNKGLKKLDIGALGIETEQELIDAMAAAKADPKLGAALESVRKKYNAYNRGMIEWLSSPQVAAISQADAKAYLKDEDYVPYYRVRADGTAELVFGGEKTLTIGDIRHQPYLAELKGGEAKIMPLDKSIMRNTMLLVTKGMNNMAMKNVGYAMQAAGDGLGPIGKNGKPTNLMPILSGKGPDQANVIRWTQEPDPNKPDDKGDRYLRVETNDTLFGGIPAELIVKSLDGAHLTLPAFLKWGGIAGDLLRSGITRTPIYLARQLFRDPFAATATSGLDYGPLTAIFKANKEFLKIAAGKSETGAKMIEKGLLQSGLFEGDVANMSKIALQLASGKSQGVIDRVLAGADRLALQADAATRTLIYDNAIKNGLSEAEADYAVRESMNFSKRGLSPTVQYASRMIPFFNAQIQGLSVLVKAATGNMPSEDVLKIKRKFANNAMMLTGFGLAYAMAMDDDEYYKNAKPRDRYSNFFVPLPGVDEPLKLPIPYEFGFFFSAGVALADSIKGEVDTPQQLRAIKDMFVGAIPGASSNFVPQLVKPLAEVYANRSFFSGTPLESSRLEKLAPEARYNAHTTEVAKWMATMVPGLSPIQIEHIVSGYLGQIPLMVLASTNEMFREGKEEPTRKLSEMPLIGSSFQRKYGGEDADVVYKLANDSMEAKRTFDNYRKTGKIEDAKEFLADNRAEIMVAPLAAQYQKFMGALRKQEEIIRGSNMPPDVKEKRIDALNEQRQLQSERYLKAIRRAEAAGGRTTPQ